MGERNEKLSGKTIVNLPIIFYHEGYQEYIEFAVAQAKKTNPHSAIYLVGDDDVLKKLITRKGIIAINKKKYEHSFSEFVNVYEHHSTNPHNYELICFIRWFVIRDVMKTNRIDTAFVCDTDCLIYSNISKVYPEYEASYGSLMVSKEQSPFEWVASSAASFWTIGGLNIFLNYLLGVYRQGVIIEFGEKIKFHNDTSAPGGICDMTILYKFYLENIEKFSNILSIRSNGTFDGNFNATSNEFENEYAHDGNHKTIKLLNYKPYGYSLLKKNDVQFHLLHFQGNSKKYMHSFYIGSKMLILRLSMRSKASKLQLKFLSLKERLMKAGNV